jgi:hypothetical protein
VVNNGFSGLAGLIDFCGRYEGEFAGIYFEWSVGGDILRKGAEVSELSIAGNTPGSAKDAEFFIKNKEFVYLASGYDHQLRSAVTDTITLTSSGTRWDRDSPQKTIGWKNRTSGAGSGVIENDACVWIHPPRFNRYDILELSPFPEVKKPFVPSQEWDWQLELGSHWSNPAWAVWKGNMLVGTHYKAIGKRTVATALGKLVCEEVRVVPRCS